MTQALQYAVFSFNRGPFLAHCVRSIERCAPGASIHVIDDASDDPETRQVLEALSARHTVTVARPSGQHKHGGLYANLQTALDAALPDTPLCFLQDDTQLVRPVIRQDHDAIARFFATGPQASFLSPTFIRRSRPDRAPDALIFDHDVGVYWPKRQPQNAGVYYSDISIVLPQRLRGAGWRFLIGESRNELQAADRFGRMGILAAPFAMWLPLVPAWRGKRKTWALTMGERRSGCGFHPIVPMTDDEADALRSRPPDVLPYVEDFLRVHGRSLAEPWRYNGLQGQRLLKWLNGLELALGRLAGAGKR